MQNMTEKEAKGSILVVCSHSDDQIIGAGGTLAKYASEGKNIYTCILAYGESSHPHLKEEVISSIRVKESIQADKVIGGNGVEFLGVKEGDFSINENVVFIKDQLKKIIEHQKPNKIFTHSWDDFHPDHRATYKVVQELISEMQFKCDCYSFEIWNPFTATNSNFPRLVVDISDTFSTKLKALKCFKSQKITLITMIPAVYIRAFVNGLESNAKYAEVF